MRKLYRDGASNRLLHCFFVHFQLFCIKKRLYLFWPRLFFLLRREQWAVFLILNRLVSTMLEHPSFHVDLVGETIGLRFFFWCEWGVFGSRTLAEERKLRCFHLISDGEAVNFGGFFNADVIS